MQACEKATILCNHKHKCYSVQFEVLDETVPNILGLHTCMEMNLIQRIDAIESHTGLLNSYSDVFEGLGCITDAVCYINVDQNTLPIVYPPRKVPVTLRPKLQQKLLRMEKRDVMQKVNKPTEWVTSMVTIVKPNGNLWICIDPRDLNKAIK